MDGRRVKILLPLAAILLLQGCFADSVQTSREVQLGYEAGTVSLPSRAASVTLPSGVSWLVLRESSVIVLENRTYDPRTATVRYLERGQECTLTIHQACRDAILLSSGTLSTLAEGEVFSFPVSANVDVSVSSDANWLLCTAVKGLEQNPFTLTVMANLSGSPRTGTLTFTGGDVTQTVQVSQPALSGQLVTRLTAPGVYLGSSGERVYRKGKDQFASVEDTFVFLNRKEREQIEVSGYGKGWPVGYPVKLLVRWKKQGREVLSQEYNMCVLKEEGNQVWIGNGNGQGVILRK